MNVTIRIDGVVLDGIQLGPLEREQFRIALERELSGLLQARGLAPGLSAGTAVPSLATADVVLRGVDVSHVAARVGAAVAGALGGPGSPRGESVGEGAR